MVFLYEVKVTLNITYDGYERTSVNPVMTRYYVMIVVLLSLLQLFSFLLCCYIVVTSCKDASCLELGLYYRENFVGREIN